MIRLPPASAATRAPAVAKFRHGLHTWRVGRPRRRADRVLVSLFEPRGLAQNPRRSLRFGVPSKKRIRHGD